MKGTLLASVCFVLLGLQSHSQNCEIFGTWKLTGYEVSGKFKGVEDTVHSFLSFYQDEKIQSNYAVGKDSHRTKMVNQGTYVITNEKTIRYQYEHQQPRKIRIISCSDSALVLEFEYIEIGKRKEFFEKEKEIIPYKAHETIQGDKEQRKSDSSENKEADAVFYLVNMDHPDQKIELKSNGETSITFKRQSPFFPDQKEEISFKASILDVDSLTIKFENYYYSANTDFTRDTCDIRLRVDYNINSGQDVEMPLKNLEWIDYTSPGANTGQSIGAFLVTAGIYSLLFATPIVSINSKKGTFDREKAYIVIGASVGVGLLSIPFFATSKTKHYKMNKDVFDHDQDYWRIVKWE